MTVDPGKNFEGQRGFPTPDSTPDDTACRVFRVPANDDWLGVLMGAVEVLLQDYNWYNWGSISIPDTVAAWANIVQASYDESMTGTCPTDTIDAPFWDSDEDVDDELPDDVQPWYGTVSDPEAPPDELDFVENAAIWALTGFLAVATIEIAAAPAILFHTIAPRFVLAMKRGDVGEIIRILVDGEEAARVDTTPYAAGDVIRQPVLTTNGADGHDIALVQVS